MLQIGTALTEKVDILLLFHPSVMLDSSLCQQVPSRGGKQVGLKLGFRGGGAHVGWVKYLQPVLNAGRTNPGSITCGKTSFECHFLCLVDKRLIGQPNRQGGWGRV